MQGVRNIIWVSIQLVLVWVDRDGGGCPPEGPAHALPAKHSSVDSLGAPNITSQSAAGMLGASMPIVYTVHTCI